MRELLEELGYKKISKKWKNEYANGSKAIVHILDADGLYSVEEVFVDGMYVNKAALFKVLVLVWQVDEDGVERAWTFYQDPKNLLWKTYFGGIILIR